jgi:hypothetical protein
VSRLCHRGPGFRRAFATPMLSPGVARPGLALLGSSPWRRDGPNVACRLLQPILDPRARPSDRPNPAHRAHGRPREQLFFEPLPFGSGTDCGWLCASARQPRRHGPGADSKAFAFVRGSSRRDRSRWELHPNPIGSDTSCREIVTPPAGDRRCQAITWMTSVRTRPACPASPRCSPSRVASRKPPRRGMRSAEPEVPSIGGPPRERWVPSSPGCPQPVE